MGVWQDYAPTWSSLSNPQPAIGNGTMTAKYRRVGDSVELQVAISPGSTTTFGTDEWYFGLPPGLTVAGSAADPVGHAFAWDNAGNGYPGVVMRASGNRLRVLGGLNWRPTHPFAWGSGDMMVLRATVPVAEYAL